MGAEKGKKQRSGETEEEKNGSEVIDGELVQSIEKLQAIQEDLEKVILLSFVSLQFAILRSFFAESWRLCREFLNLAAFSYSYCCISFLGVQDYY